MKIDNLKLITNSKFRRHGNTGRQPKNAFTHEEENHVVSFIQNYSEANAILLPGRIPGYKQFNIQLLPSSTSKRAVYKEFIKVNTETHFRTVSESAFNSVWRKYLPHIVITKPMSDLCLQCQKNSSAIVRSTNTSVENQSLVSLL